MVYPPGQGKSGAYLMRLWRRYLEQYADREGDVEGQIVAAAYHSAEIFGFLSLMLDREGTRRSTIEDRIELFEEASSRAGDFEDRLVNAAFTLYNHANTLSRQFAAGNGKLEDLIGQVDEQVRGRTEKATDRVSRSAAALQAFFPLLALMTLVLDKNGSVAQAVRRVQERFAGGAEHASTDWEQLLNALYRAVEMMQIFVALSDIALADQVKQIAARFEEEDRTPKLEPKLRNGFCRLFELGHLLATHLDEVIE